MFDFVLLSFLVMGAATVLLVAGIAIGWGLVRKNK
jgi:hypothetical protein